MKKGLFVFDFSDLYLITSVFLRITTILWRVERALFTFSLIHATKSVYNSTITFFSFT